MTTFKHSRRQSKERDQGWREALHNDKGSVRQGDITVLTMCALNNRILNYLRQKQMKLQGARGVHSHSWDFTTPPPPAHRGRPSGRDSVRTQWSSTAPPINSLTWTSVGYLIQQREEYQFFPSPCGIFSKTDLKVGHKTHLNKFTSTELIQCLPSDNVELN